MEETVDMFIKETLVMHEAYREHLLKLKKQRQDAYDSLASIDVICSFWRESDDHDSLLRIRQNIQKFIDTVTQNIKSIDSIHSEITSRKQSIKNIMLRLLTLYRDLSTDDSRDSEDQKTTPDALASITDSIFSTHPDCPYSSPPIQIQGPPYQCPQSSHQE